MTHEVVVVGGGIGGLTVAALLAARGLDVCLLERGSEVGGCAASIQKFGYTFEPSSGFYGGWQAGGIHERVFGELPVDPPGTRMLDPGYVVRLSDGSDVSLSSNTDRFEKNLSAAFPECAAAAIRFYRALVPVGRSLAKALRKVPDLYTAGRLKRLEAFSPNFLNSYQLAKLAHERTANLLSGTSERFRSFIDTQVRTLTGCSIADCSYLYACVLLSAARDHLVSIDGGVAALTERLAEAIKKSGGKIRLDTPVLRLAYDSNDRAIGVDLLSGETVHATRSIISNLTVWDTYGKLVGMSRTPNGLRKELATLVAQGTYLIYAGIDESAVQRLPARNLLTRVGDPKKGQVEKQLTIAISSQKHSRAPDGKRAVTIQAPTDVNDWFTYHEDETEHETRDQSMLEECWKDLHMALPELGDRIEVIDTVTPRFFYDNTRRKLGMVGAPSQLYRLEKSLVLSHRTSVPNLLRVGDTAFPGAGIAAVTHSALIVANSLTQL